MQKGRLPKKTTREPSPESTTSEDDEYELEQDDDDDGDDDHDDGEDDDDQSEEEEEQHSEEDKEEEHDERQEEHVTEEEEITFRLYLYESSGDSDIIAGLLFYVNIRLYTKKGKKHKTFIKDVLALSIFLFLVYFNAGIKVEGCCIHHN